MTPTTRFRDNVPVETAVVDAGIQQSREQFVSILCNGAGHSGWAALEN
jgi:hypothetical protein